MNPQNAGERRLMYSNFLTLYVQRFNLPSGNTYDYDIVKISDGVGALVFLDDNTLLLERHFRPPINKSQLEIVCGGIKQGECPTDAIRRELLEETGYSGDIYFMTSAHPMPGSLDNKFHLYYANNLVKVSDGEKDEKESFEIVTMPYDKLLDEIRIGKHTDAPLIMAMLYYECFFRNKGS